MGRLFDDVTKSVSSIDEIPLSTVKRRVELRSMGDVVSEVVLQGRRVTLRYIRIRLTTVLDDSCVAFPKQKIELTVTREPRKMH